MLKLEFQEDCCDSMAFKIAPSNSPIISCLNFISIPTQVVISKPDSNFKHGPTIKFQWKGNEVDDDVGVIEFGTKFFCRLS